MNLDDRAISRWRFHTQHLSGPPAASIEATVAHLLGVQAENHAQAMWALAARCEGVTEADVSQLFDSGAILRTHVLRPTWHFVSPDDIRWLLDLTRPRIRRTFRQLQKSVEATDAEIEAAAQIVEDSVKEEGPLTRDQLGERLEDAGFEGSGYRLVLALVQTELEAVICSGPMIGNEHTYALLAERAPGSRALDRDEALAELVLRYFSSHGPATERDLAYWATQTLTDVRAGLKAVGDSLESFDHDGRTYWHSSPRQEGDQPVAGHLLQLLDECYRGYQDSRWVIDAEEIVPRTREPAIGIAVVDAQIVAHMRRTLRADSVEFELGPYRKLSDDDLALLEATAADYGRFLDLEPIVTLVD